jgi:type III pantothenate kinase
MNILAVDAGNTRLKWGISARGEWIAGGAVATGDAEAIADALGGNAAVQRIVIANVAGDSAAQVIAAALPAAQNTVWVTSRAEQCGVRSSYAEPAQLGADRWAALIGAQALQGGPCVVVNAGTTMTVDALSADGIFLGGSIVAGYDLMREALVRSTAQLRPQAGEFTFFPDNTDDAIASGAINALAGAVERMVDYVTDAGEDEPTVLLSGGNAKLLEPRLTSRVFYVENIVLEGLIVIGSSDV